MKNETSPNSTVVFTAPFEYRVVCLLNDATATTYDMQIVSLLGFYFLPFYNDTKRWSIEIDRIICIVPICQFSYVIDICIWQYIS